MLTAEAIKKSADSLRESHMSGADGADPLAIAKDLDIQIFFRAIGSLKGLYYIPDNSPRIILSSSLGDNQTAIVCAHELGHHMLHREFAHHILFPEYDLFHTQVKWEIEANQFAAYLLIPDQLLEDSLAEIPDAGLSLEELAFRCSTTPQLLAIGLGVSERPVVFPDGSVRNLS